MRTEQRKNWVNSTIERNRENPTTEKELPSTYVNWSQLYLHTSIKQVREGVDIRFNLQGKTLTSNNKLKQNKFAELCYIIRF